MSFIRAAGRTAIGGARNRENQDMFLISGRQFCVADGHGKAGKNVAELVRATVETAPPDMSFEELFAFADDNVQMMLDGSPATTSSGTTLSLVKIDTDGTCRIAHVGDSEVRCYDSDEGEGTSWTHDHDPCCIREFHRIRNAVGEPNIVFYHPGCLFKRPVFVEKDGEWSMNSQGGFVKCNVRDEWMSYVFTEGGGYLAMTRAIGDFHMRSAGIISIPDVMVIEPLKSGTRAVVLASDGLWDSMHYKEVRAIVRHPECLANVELAADRLMEATLTRGTELFGRELDNITLIVIYIQY